MNTKEEDGKKQSGWQNECNVEENVSSIGRTSGKWYFDGILVEKIDNNLQWHAA